MVWEQKTKPTAGPAVVIGSAPVPGPDEAWLVEVYDSTASPHGDDSRPTDPRAEVLATNGQRSGAVGVNLWLRKLTKPAGGGLSSAGNLNRAFSGGTYHARIADGLVFAVCSRYPLCRARPLPTNVRDLRDPIRGF